MRKERCWNRAQDGGLGVHQPFPFGEDKLDEESKTSLNVPFELAFTPIKMN